MLIIIMISRICVILNSAWLLLVEGSQCDLLAAKASLEDQNTIVDTSPKQLVGTWLSEGCETRPGPEYILRSYTFKEDGTYRLTQHRYRDSSCSSPKLTITSVGLLRLKHHHAEEVARGFARPINVTLIPRDAKAAKDLDNTINTTCPELRRNPCKQLEECIVFDKIQAKTSCLHHYSEWILDELKSVRIQSRRPINLTEFETMDERTELLLHDVEDSPIAFQVPLLKFTGASAQNDDETPPRLPKNPYLPPHVWGDWVSTRCEIRSSSGRYLTRRFTFVSSNWIGRHNFFLDPFCALPKYTATVSGRFRIIGLSNSVDAATDIDFEIEGATVIILDRKLAENMAQVSTCGIDSWQVDVPQELRQQAKSCLGLLVPSTKRDIVKLEVSREGVSLLYLGQGRRILTERPTSYQDPLRQCGSYDVDYYNRGSNLILKRSVLLALILAITVNF